MMKSMTGFGKGICGTVTVEIKTVNNRFLEVNPRLPKGLSSVDIPLRKLVGGHIKRGTADVYVTLSGSEAKYTLSADYALVKQYVDLAQRLKNDAGIENDLKFTGLIKCADVIKFESGGVNPDDDAELLAQACLTAAREAIGGLEEMRVMEGAAIKNGLEELIGEFCLRLQNVKTVFANSVEDVKVKLHARIKELLKDVEMDENRFINEAAFLADKADINEELLRLDSHINQFKAEIASSADIGRKLEFLSQEIGREVNTIGSKSAEILISQGVIEMKNTLEKIKEQIRNIE